MSDNRNTEAAWRYHRGTKHPDGFLLDPTHRYRPHQRPLLFKHYRDVETVDLEVSVDRLQVPALEAIAINGVDSREKSIPDVNEIAAMCYFSAGITKRIHYRGYGEMTFRAASCTGALYHIELYLVCGGLPGLPAGVYHFDPAEMALDVLRQGEYRRVLYNASGGHPTLAHAPAVFVYSDVPYRNACKYQSREYRHAFWDSGTILSHSLAVAGALEAPHHLVLGFEDAAVNDLLGLDPREEFALALLPLGIDPGKALPAADEQLPLRLETAPISKEKEGYPAIQEMHRSSSLSSKEKVKKWRAAQHLEEPPAGNELIALDPLSGERCPADSLSDVIRRRGSSREFVQDTLRFQELSTLLVRSAQGIPADFTGKEGLSQNSIYLIVHAVDDLEAGAYVYHPGEESLELLRQGNFRRESRQLALGQALGGDCAAAIYFLANLDAVLDAYGNRGYRTAQMEASITAGKMYLAAYAQSFGATGLTFFDDQVTDFFSPHAEGKSVMFLIAVGVPA